MAKSRSVVADYTVYLLLRFFVCVVQAMPLAMGQWLAGVLAWMVYHLDKRHRDVAVDNLRHAFKDDYTEAERDKLVRAVFRHFCSLAIEIIHLPRCAHANNWRKYLALPQAKLVCGNLLSKRPRIFVTSHFGNWELTGFILGATGFKISSIARTLDNPFVDHFLRVKFREKTGQQILSKDGDFDRIQHVLANGGVLGTLGDQDAGKRGLFVDFFGRPASTHKAIALLTLEHGAILTVSGMARIGWPLRYKDIIEDVILPEEYEGNPDAVRLITQRFTSALERIIRRHPEQYFWLHRRWKHQPTAKARRKAA
jgi:Kdo2-lipid IVA lauroyltransferase/acyltransferase